ncbi:MAG TPA: HD domain-containing phosphohydrolase [Gaiellaceae bacterium]|nr:HD domain-containing phosphohydrolase [Gaiellaceae bacterium]
MTRVPPKARGLVIGMVTAGTTVLAVAAVKAAGAPYATLALLGAAAILTELIQISSDDSSSDPGDAHSFSFSTGVHIAAVLLVGPWAAALVAAFGVIVVDTLRGSPRAKVAYNASAFALSIFVGGLAFEALGGVAGTLEFSRDFVAIGALVVVVYLLNNLLMSAVVAFHEGTTLWPLARDAGLDGLQSAAAEAGLGVVFARFALYDPWAVVVVVPLVLAVYQAYARLAFLRRETARALETFANLIDERDASTYRHSARVADYVEELAQRLGFPSVEVARLRWAGRLHDLGKIAVDASVLRKPGELAEDEWQLVRRHPRLSARLLGRFRYAEDESRAVEFHHERADGHGYYGIDPADIPLAAHFLIVADSYDAMTSDRAYRRGLPKEHALAEIEKNLGAQFHTAVGKAFVALQRGQDPQAVLTDAERREMRNLLGSNRRPILRRRDLRPEHVTAAGVVGALAAVGLGVPLLAVPAVLLAAAGLTLLQIATYRERRLVRGLTSVLHGERSRAETFSQIAAVIAGACDLRWAGLIGWKERDCTGSLELEWSAGGSAAGETALMSWLLREAESSESLRVSDGSELGKRETHVALPLHCGETVVGYIVLALDGRPPGRSRAR